MRRCGGCRRVNLHDAVANPPNAEGYSIRLIASGDMQRAELIMRRSCAPLQVLFFDLCWQSGVMIVSSASRLTHPPDAPRSDSR